MKRKLTDRFIQGVKPPLAGRLFISDVEIRGLALRVTTNGTKSWIVKYRVKGEGPRPNEHSKPRLVQHSEVPGAYPAVSLAVARQRAREVIAAAKRGVNLPEQERQDREARRRAAAAARSVRHIVTDYTKHCRSSGLRSWRQKEGVLERHVVPRLGNKSIAELRRADVVELLDHLQHERGFRQLVNRVLSHTSAMLDWALERQYVTENITAGIKRRDVETEDERVLSPAELRAIWRAAEKEPFPHGAWIRALILTGMRRNEVRCLPWSEIDGAAALWTLPKARNKSKRDHEAPLSTAMIELLGTAPRNKGPYVFSLNGKTPFGGYQRLKERLDQASGVTDWIYHDIRRTVRSGLGELGIADELAERCLNHSLGKLTRIYNRHAYRDEKRAAMQAWADRVGLIVSEGRDAPNVVELRAGA